MKFYISKYKQDIYIQSSEKHDMLIKGTVMISSRQILTKDNMMYMLPNFSEEFLDFLLFVNIEYTDEYVYDLKISTRFNYYYQQEEIIAKLTNEPLYLEFKKSSFNYQSISSYKNIIVPMPQLSKRIIWHQFS